MHIVTFIPCCYTGSFSLYQLTAQILAQRDLVHALLQIEGLYLMMGRGLERLAEVPAGNVAAFGGLGTAILKSATLSSTPCCRPLAPMMFQVGLSLSGTQFAAQKGLTRSSTLMCHQRLVTATHVHQVGVRSAWQSLLQAVPCRADCCGEAACVQK